MYERDSWELSLKGFQGGWRYKGGQEHTVHLSWGSYAGEMCPRIEAYLECSHQCCGQIHWTVFCIDKVPTAAVKPVSAPKHSRCAQTQY